MTSALTAQAVPALRRGIRRHYDTARGQHVLLCPERVVLLDDISHAITELCDGQRSIAVISATLAACYEEDPAQVEADVLGFMQELLDKGLMSV